MNRSRSRGFTLLEIMVALAVVSIAMMALISSGANYARIQGELKERSLTHWIAQNRIAELEMKNSPPPIGEYNGTEWMGGVEWPWQVRVTTTPDDLVYRIDVYVQPLTERGQMQRQLTSYTTALTPGAEK